MPHSHKPDTTKIQDMFNDILSFKEKTEQFGPTCTTGQSSASHNVSNKQIEAVNGNLKKSHENSFKDHEILSVPESNLQGNDHDIKTDYPRLSVFDVAPSKNAISSDTCRKEELISTKHEASKNFLLTHKIQSALHSNSCSDTSSETEDYFDQESVSTASLSCSPFLPKKINSSSSAIDTCQIQNTPLSSADETAATSGASDLENLEELPSTINKDDQWYVQSITGVKEDSPEYGHDISRIAEENAAIAFLNPTTATTISSWLSRVQSHGFPADVLQTYMSDEVCYEDDETWWDPSVVRIFDPYYDICTEDIDKVTEGNTNASGTPVGQCTIQLTNGDEVYGNFRKGVRQGRGSIFGSNMEKHGVSSIRGYYRDGVLMGEGRVVLSGGKPLFDRTGSQEETLCNPPYLPYPYPYFKGYVALEGIFNDGYLEGPVRGTDEKGQLVFVGMYSKGLPIGYCWQAMEGQGWLYGQVDSQTGQFTGDDIAYIYPDLLTCIVGKFEQGRLVKGAPSCIIEASYGNLSDYIGDRSASGIETRPIIFLQIMKPEEYSSRLQNIFTETLMTKKHKDYGKIFETHNGSSDEDQEYDETYSVTSYKDIRSYSYCPSDSINVACDWTLRDPYERVTVTCRPSNLPQHAGDGLYALRDIPEKTIVAYYNGIRLMPGECYTSTSYNYQIYVDWLNTDDSPSIDIPRECVDAGSYCASLAHKANHGFKPNCRYVPADHPRFGRVPSLETLTAIRKGEELFSHYKYDSALAPNWYQEAWNRFTHPEEYQDDE